MFNCIISNDNKMLKAKEFNKFNKYLLNKSLLKCLVMSVFLVWSLMFHYVLAATEGDSNTTKTDPVQFLHHITDQVLTNIKEKQQHNENSVEKIINQIIMPNVDFDEMGKWIAGRSTWDKCTGSEQEDFIKQIKYMLIKTYAATLNNYSEEKIEFQHYAGDLSVKRIQIKSKVIRANKDNLSVDYRLVSKENTWKVYDVIIEGVSILNGFRAQFGDDIRQHGLVAVTEKIKQHNDR